MVEEKDAMQARVQQIKEEARVDKNKAVEAMEEPERATALHLHEISKASAPALLPKTREINPPIILIGPLGAGKSTIGRLLAEKLTLPLCSIDKVRSAYYEKVGYDETLASKITALEGIRGVLRYCEPFDAQMVERILTDHHHGIIDFGASNSIYDDKALLSQIENLLAPYPNVILLLPSADLAESAEILKNRLTQMLYEAGKEISDELFELNEFFINHLSNYRLAKRIIYTGSKMPEEICDELVQNLSSSGEVAPPMAA